MLVLSRYRDETIMIGDTISDIHAGLNAKCSKVLGVLTGGYKSHELHNADSILNSIDELPNYICNNSEILCLISDITTNWWSNLSCNPSFLKKNNLIETSWGEESSKNRDWLNKAMELPINKLIGLDSWKK